MPRSRASEAGYTLLEVMLALMILGAASALVVVAMPPPEPTLKGEARTLAARLTVAAEEAIVSGSPIGIDLKANGYSFHRRVAGEWAPITDDPSLKTQTWPEGAVVEVTRDGALLPPPSESSFGRTLLTPDGRPIVPPPTARFDPAGAATTLAISLRDETGGWRVEVDVSGAVSLTGEAG